MQRERWEQTPLCSLCPGPFFFSIPIQCRLEKTNKQPSAIVPELGLAEPPHVRWEERSVFPSHILSPCK